MKKYYWLIFMTISFIFIVYPISSVHAQIHGYRSVATTFASNDSTILIGNGYGVFKSTNEGIKWNQVYSKNKINCYSISAVFVKDSIILIGCFDSRIYRSTNNGKDWNLVYEANSTSSIKDIIASDNMLFCVSEYGTYRSTNNGENWTELETGNNGPVTNAIVAKGDTLYLCTDLGIQRSIDNGNSWQQIINTAYGCTSIVFNDEMIFVATSGQGILKSTDNGISWVKVNNGLPSTYIRSVVAIGENIYALLLFEGSISRSTDNGANWFGYNNGLGNGVYVGLLYCCEYGLFAGTDKGLFYRQQNGTIWQKRENGLRSGIINDFTKINSNLFVASDDGVLLCKNDENWCTEVNNGLLDLSIKTIIASDSILFAGTNSGLFVSSDNALNWTKPNNGLNNSIINSFYKTDSLLYCCTTTGVFVSANQGNDWTILSNYLNNLDISTLTISGSNMLLGTNNGMILSSDNGITWVTADLPATKINKLFNTNGKVFAATEIGLFYSTNNGLVWQKINGGLPPGSQFKTITGNENKLFVSIVGKGLYFSQDYGLNWHSISYPQNITSLFVDDKYLYFGYYDEAGFINRCDLSYIYVDVEEIPTNIPFNYMLSQNYPNPFNPSTTISFSLPAKEFVTLKIYDALGKEVTTLVNEEFNAGSYKNDWNAGNLSSGIYFYRLQAGKYSETRKLILLK